MNETFIGLLIKNYRELIREKKRNIILLSLPLVMFAFIYFFFSSSQVEKTFLEPISIGIIDKDNSLYSNILIENYKDNDSFTDFINIIVGDENNIKQSFNKGEYEAIIEIPENFSDSLMHFEHVPINVKINYSNPMKAVLLKNVLKSYEDFITSVEVGVEVLYDKMKELGMDKEEISLYNYEISYELIFTTLGRNKFFNYKPIINIPSTTSVNYFFIAIIMIFLMYISIFTAIDLIRDRENMCLKRLKITKTSIFYYLWAKLISSTFFILVIIGIWYIMISLVTNLTIHGNPFITIFYVMSCIFLSVSFAILMSSLFKRDESVFLISNVFIFVNAIIGGSIIPIHFMPEILQKIAILSPNYWMIKGLLYIDSGYLTGSGILIMAIFLIVSIIFTYFAFIRYKKVI